MLSGERLNCGLSRGVYLLSSVPMKSAIVLISVIVIGTLSACSQTASAPTASTTAATTKLLIEAREFSYTPAQHVVKVGQTVEIELQNTGVVVHDLSIEKIALKDKSVTTSQNDGHMTGGMMDDHMSNVNVDEFSLHVAAEAEQIGKVTFTPTEPGEYEFYCTVPGHKASGMVGTLIVVTQ